MPKRHIGEPDTSTQAGRLRWARENANIGSARAAAQLFGWNENTYKSHEQGIRGAEGIKTKHLAKYARAFKVSEAWLATGKGHPTDPNLTPEELEAARRLLRAINE